MQGDVEEGEVDVSGGQVKSARSMIPSLVARRPNIKAIGVWEEVYK